MQIAKQDQDSLCIGAEDRFHDHRPSRVTRCLLRFAVPDGGMKQAAYR
jgi:hypothetical protein